MRYQVNAPFMTIGELGAIVSREQTGMSDEGLARAVRSGRLIELDEPDYEPGKWIPLQGGEIIASMLLPEVD